MQYGPDLETFTYTGSGDSIVSAKLHYLAGCSNCTSSFYFNFYKSKTRSDVFYLFGHKYIDPTPYYVFLGKYDMNSRLWTRGYRWSAAPATVGDGLDEDEKGNVYGVANTLNSKWFHYSGYIKFDSLGNSDGNWRKYFDGYNSGGFYYPDDRFNVIHSNKLLMNVEGTGFPSNPLTAEVVTSSVMACAPGTSLVNMESNGLQMFSQVSKPDQYTVTISNMGTVLPGVSAVTGFSLNNSFCTIMNSPEFSLANEIRVFPVPVSQTLFIESHTVEISEIQIYDVSGKEVERKQHAEKIDVSKYIPGIYLIKIATDKGLVMKKFLKE